MMFLNQQSRDMTWSSDIDVIRISWKIRDGKRPDPIRLERINMTSAEEAGTRSIPPGRAPQSLKFESMYDVNLALAIA